MRLERGKPVLFSDVGPWWDVMGRSPAGFYSYGSSSQMASIYWPILCALCEVCMQFKWSLFSASFAFSLPPSPTCTYIPNWPLSCFSFSLAIRGNYAGTILQIYQLDSPQSPLLLETFSHLTPPSISEKSARLANCAVDVVLKVVFLCDAAAFWLNRNFKTHLYVLPLWVSADFSKCYLKKCYLNLELPLHSANLERMHLLSRFLVVLLFLLFNFPELFSMKSLKYHNK